MSGQSPTTTARTGGNPFLRAVAALSTLAGWVSAAMIVAAVAITCQMIVIRFVLNGSTVWQTEAVVYLMVAATLIGLPSITGQMAWQWPFLEQARVLRETQLGRVTPLAFLGGAGVGEMQLPQVFQTWR